MSIQLYIGHTGQRLRLDPAITTLEALRPWLETKTSIAPRAQILLTATGKQVRSQTLLNENELFVFDSKLFTSTTPTSAPTIDAIRTVEPESVPDVSGDQNSLSTWQSLFARRKSWAQAVLSACIKQADLTDTLLDQNYVISRSVGVAVASLQQHVKSGEKKYSTVATWVDEVMQEHEAHTSGWERNLESLRDVPARAEFVRFVNPAMAGSRRLSQANATTTLQAFVDVAKIKQAATAASRMQAELSKRLTSLNTKLSSAASDSDELLQAVELFQNSSQSQQDSESEPTQLRKEIEIVVRKMTSDAQHVQSLPPTNVSVPQASKMALLHTRNHIPSLLEYCAEMNELIQRTHQKRLDVAAASLDYMRTLSAIESRLAELYSETTSFGLSEEHKQEMAALTVLGRLPSVYGQLLVESTRRREWVTKMKHDSAVLQEEMATYQEEEEKRRRKWIHSVEDVVSIEAIEATRALGIELSLQNEGGSWPAVAREELTEYLQTLRQTYGPGPVVEEMDLAIKELDKPTRKQIKRAKAFKNGSMHEAAFGDTSLLLRGEEHNKVVRDTNARLEEDLKASKSRIRKLEDLLHRSTQNSRSNTGDLFGAHGMGDRRITPPYFPSSQVSGELSPSTSARHRRLSSNLGIEEKKLARRVVDLEAELQVFRDEAVSRKNSDADAQRQIDDAVSTKKDLMENMEAQQREFATERRNLEVELREAKDKLEEIESEIERMAGSRDDERTGIGARFASLEEEMKQLKDDAAGHAARAATEQDNRHAMEQKLRVAENARASAEEELQRLRLEQELTREAQNEQIERLASAFHHLAAETPIPNTIAGISIALDDLARRSSAHVNDLEEAVAFARSEKDSLRAINETQRADLVSAAQKRIDVEDEARRGREQLSAEKAKSNSLQKQLQDEQDQLKLLRSKFADGETGSEVLRQRVIDEEARAGRLTSQLAAAQSQVNNLSGEISRIQQDRQESQAQYDSTAGRLEKRGFRAKDISHKLYAQNARIGRLVERLGLAISYNDNTMTVERASKMNASTTMGDPALALSRTTSRTSPPPTRKSSQSEESSDLSMLRWSNAQSSEEETVQYEAFAQHLSRFNIETIADAIVKRVRDFEYTAKKYNKEAKEATKRADAYKDRTIRLRGEAHSKLAVKDFKEGDLALFLPTRGQAKGAWAAFNIGCPHYFLAEKDGMRLASRDFIVARISKVEQKVVDLSKSHAADGRSLDETSEAQSFEDDNPFDLSDGLTWWMVHASEERVAGAAPIAPGSSKSTVAAANVDARGSVRVKRSSKGDDASKHLNKSLDSRRSSTGSKKSVAGAVKPTIANLAGSPVANELLAARQRSESQVSLRPPPSSPGAITQGVQASGLASGLGIVASTNELDEARPLHDQVRKLSSQNVPRALSSSPTKDSRRVRSTSPSKSIRSLQRHLETSPTRPGSRGWNNLFSADFTLSSPTKGDQA